MKYLFRMLMAGGKKRQAKKMETLIPRMVRRVAAAGGVLGNQREDWGGGS